MWNLFFASWNESLNLIATVAVHAVHTSGYLRPLVHDEFDVPTGWTSFDSTMSPKLRNHQYLTFDWHNLLLVFS